MKKAVLFLFLLIGAYSLRAQSLTDKDVKFVQNTYQCGLYKVKLGELTAAKAKSDSVKVLGRRILVEHTKANEELKSLAVAKNISLPDYLSPEDQKHYDELVSTWGADFDQSFVQIMITDHKKAVDAFKNEDLEGSDTEVRSWASVNLPIIKHHLMLSQDLAVDLEKKKEKTRSENESRSRQGADKVGTLK